MCNEKALVYQDDSLGNLDSVRSNSSATAPKSLRESQEQPVNLSEQPSLTGKVNVQILSPNTDRVCSLPIDQSMMNFSCFLFQDNSTILR